jgi:hypothetical protein
MEDDRMKDGATFLRFHVLVGLEHFQTEDEEEDRIQTHFKTRPNRCALASARFPVLELYGE